MIFGNESISHYTRSNIPIWMTMAFQAGFLNIGGFMACHRFVSHVTGFATFFGYEANQPGMGQAFGMLIVPFFFLFGCMLSGQLVDIRLKTQRPPRYFVVFGLMFSLLTLTTWLGVAGYFGEFGESLQYSRDYALLALLCLVCGIQNGTITTVSKSVIRTTHLTGITTDLGIGIMRFLHRHQLKDPIENEVKANLMRVGIIMFFVLGSLAGGFVFMRIQYLGFLFPTLISGILFSLMLYFQAIRPQKEKS
jgi:uncharacterized membrane protein YoaK (UPF0700 family)